MDVKKFLPLLLLIGGGLLVAKHGPKLLKSVQNMVDTKLQRSELADTAKALRVDLADGNHVPRPGRADELANYLRDMRTGEGGRDMALDKWGHAFALEWRTGREAVLRSHGANGDRDACTTEDLGDASGDDICETIDFTPPSAKPAP